VIAELVVLTVMMGILLASVFGSGGGDLKTDPHSQVAWVIVMVVVVVAEFYLIVARDHTLSGQMQYWVRHSRVGTLMIVFWGYLLYHFAIEPLVRMFIEGVDQVRRLLQ